MNMKRFVPSASVTASLLLGMAAAASAAQPPTTGTTGPASVSVAKVPLVQQASVCIKDLSAFSDHMQTGGYWLGESGYGYGYPMGGYGYGYPMGGLGYGYAKPRRVSAADALRYDQARPGYEIRTLLAAATILAQSGQQQACEQVLATTRIIYTRYAGDIRDPGMRPGDGIIWQQNEIASALPVAGRDVPYRSDQLIDSDVRSANDTALGSVHDLVMNPDTGKIAYLVIARGGVFGIGASYVPVPWDDFKSAPHMHFLVLDSTASVLASAPQFDDSAFTQPANFAQKSKEVDAYWASRFSNKVTD